MMDRCDIVNERLRNKGAGDDPVRPYDPAPEPVGRPLRRARGRPPRPRPTAHSRTIINLSIEK